MVPGTDRFNVFGAGNDAVRGVCTPGKPGGALTVVRA